MLIYNYQKEFLGIDELDLKALGFSDFVQLRNESADFADLFVKTPGFVHNFKHVHWIDFVTCAEGSEDSKVIIHVNGKNFRCTLDIKTVFLVDDPSQKAYIVNLVNLRALTHKENEHVADDVLEKPTPKVSSQKAAIFNAPQFSESSQEEKVYEQEITQTKKTLDEVEVTHDPYETGATQTYDNLETNPMVVDDIYEDKALDLGDELLEIDEIEETHQEVEIEETPAEEIPQEEENKTVVLSQVLNVGADYVYDPHLASEELGLPVDLIEEFIQDFINQAEEFKISLYDSVNIDDIDNIKILSHKLKGVAANLRIEDAFEVLTTVNTSDDIDEIKTNIDTFYLIIKKLSGKTFQQDKPSQEPEIEEESDDDLILSFKDEDDKEETQEIEIDIPDITTLAEVSVEDTLKEEVEEEINLDLDLNIELDDFNDDLELSQDMVEPSYSKTLAADEIGIGIEDFQVLFDDYIQEGMKACDNIQEASKQNDLAKCKKIAMKLKGMSENMRIDALTQNLESIINADNIEVAKEVIDEVRTTLGHISTSEV